ncbi:hypothetical protein CWI42_041510 [Ordospora colligata]|uniref:Uncharacterized protein n=1 Tax=Ordospora colligata OC4 TaxID=1354746 RepID=A0A0B2UL06_9MICR|nr:uncharacterized protein M896_041520 [Ordospora colligata OC4]KHN69954.1 hypothetical protein M896_041520 [Ordospora colligata OC4]TBU16124.1 hypothetical protein CWI41_041510 [Ordospora colligata]TBU16337.1 hypothetical protein CWI40_041510 [Ordospora colligata]TBU19041.1 hypothetical protein CWI42_041510 [Ordospora colligata]
MKSSSFERRLFERYGEGPIPKEDVGMVLEEAVANKMIERGEIKDYKSREYEVAELLGMIRGWRTDFLKESFSLNDISCQEESSVLERSEIVDEGMRSCSADWRGESFLMRDEELLSSLRDKTRMITSRGGLNGKKMARNVLKAWEEYEERYARVSGRRYWYLCVLLVVIPLYCLYVPRPF